jgi:opacity protein-like surface antigen
MSATRATVQGSALRGLIQKGLKKMNKLAIPIALAAVTAASAATASAESLSTFTYTISAPVGDTKEFIDSTSFIGVEYNYRHFTSDRVSVGGSIGWTVLDQKRNDLVTIRTDDFNGDISGTQFRYINSFPIMATAHYYLGDTDGTHAYVGGRAGVYYVKQRVELGTVAFEVGIIAPINYSTKFIANVQYNLPFSSGTFLGGESRSWQSIGFNIGLAFGSY